MELTKEFILENSYWSPEITQQILQDREDAKKWRDFGFERIIKFVVTWYNNGYEWDEINSILNTAIKDKSIDKYLRDYNWKPHYKKDRQIVKEIKKIISRTVEEDGFIEPEMGLLEIEKILEGKKP